MLSISLQKSGIFQYFLGTLARKLRKTFFCNRHVFSIFCHPDVTNFRRVFVWFYYHFINLLLCYSFKYLLWRCLLSSPMRKLIFWQEFLCSISAVFKLDGKSIVKTKFLWMKNFTYCNFSKILTTFSRFSWFW